MARGKVELLFAMTGEDKLSAVVQKNQKRLDSFMKTAKNPAGLKSLSVNIKSASNQFTELNSKVSLMSAAASAAGAAFMSSFEFAKSGELANMVEHSFLQMAGSAEAYASKMGALRDATAFLVDETSLQQFSNRMAFMGVEFSKTTKILQVATAAAKVSGEDLLGLARRVGEAAMTGRSTALKQMGVMINLNKVQEDYARSLGKTRAELSAFEKGSVTLDAALEDIQTRFTALGVFTDDLDSNVAQMQKTFDDLESNLQQDFARALSAAKSSLDDFYDNEAHQRTMRSRIQLILKATNVIDENRDVTSKGAVSARDQADAVKRLAKAFNLSARAAGHVGGQMRILGDGYGAHLVNLEDLILHYARLNAEMKQEVLIADAQEKQAKTLAVTERDRKDILEELSHIQQNDVDIAIARRDGRKEDVKELQTFNKQAKVRIKQIKAEIGDQEAQRQQNIISLNAETDAIAAAEMRKTTARGRTAKARAEEAKKTAAALSEELNKVRLATKTKVLEIRKRMALDADMTEHGKTLSENRIRVIQYEGRAAAGEFENDRVRVLNLQILRANNKARSLASLKEFNQREQEERRENARATFEMERFNISHAFEMKQAALEQNLDQVSAGANSFASAFAPANQMMAESDRRMSDWQIGTVNAFQAVGNVAQVAAKNTDNLANAVGPGLSAMKGLTRGLVKDKQAEAGIHAAFEAAAAAASFATGNIPAGIAHSAAAAMFLAVAGPSGKSTKAKASSQGTFGAGGAQGSKSVSAGPSSVVLNVNGFVSADQNQLAKGMQDTLSGITGGGFVGGTI